jgi:hypothetical protein
MSAKYAKPYSAEDRAPKSVVFDLLTPPTAAEPDVHPALVSRATATLNIDSLHGRDTRAHRGHREKAMAFFCFPLRWAENRKGHAKGGRKEWMVDFILVRKTAKNSIEESFSAASADW